MPKKRHLVAGAVTAVAAMVLVAAPALAHVTVDPESVPQGTSDVVLNFRVPNEETTSTPPRSTCNSAGSSDRGG